LEEAAVQTTPTPETCARCGSVLRFDSRAFAPVEADDGLICPACDEAEMACAAESSVPPAVAAFCRAFDDTVTGVLA
jgi:hypothetical protein